MLLFPFPHVASEKQLAVSPYSDFEAAFWSHKARELFVHFEENIFIVLPLSKHKKTKPSTYSVSIFLFPRATIKIDLEVVQASDFVPIHPSQKAEECSLCSTIKVRITHQRNYFLHILVCPTALFFYNNLNVSSSINMSVCCTWRVWA